LQGKFLQMRRRITTTALSKLEYGDISHTRFSFASELRGASLSVS
jgi:hypothetical protein